MKRPCLPLPTIQAATTKILPTKCLNIAKPRIFCPPKITRYTVYKIIIPCYTHALTVPTVPDFEQQVHRCQLSRILSNEIAPMHEHFPLYSTFEQNSLSSCSLKLCMDIIPAQEKQPRKSGTFEVNSTFRTGHRTEQMHCSIVILFAMLVLAWHIIVSIYRITRMFCEHQQTLRWNKIRKT